MEHNATLKNILWDTLLIAFNHIISLAKQSIATLSLISSINFVFNIATFYISFFQILEKTVAKKLFAWFENEILSLFYIVVVVFWYSWCPIPEYSKEWIIVDGVLWIL